MGNLKKAVRNAAMKLKITKCFYQWLEKRKHSALIKHYEKQPVNAKLVMFEAYKGRSFACSPKAIYLAMQRDAAFSDTRFVWVFNDESNQTELGRMPRTVVTHKFSPEHIEASLTAKVIVTNSRLVRAFKYRPEQFILQTWHGTPLKRLGLDLSVSGDAVESLDKIHEEYRRDGELISALITPSPYGSLHLGSAFGLSPDSPKIWETGYPRNDFLFNYSEEDVRNIKEKLGIPSGKKVILYAPTFRDKGFVKGKGYVNELYLDILSLKKRFSKDSILILRTHYFAARQDCAEFGDFVVDGNSVDDINELYVISDIMITDYSSVMYDYAALKRPMLFYMPDLEEYKDNIRDFYMDPAQLPGPMLQKQDELEKVLGELLESTASEKTSAENGNRSGNQYSEWISKYDFDTFLQTFQPYEDGKRAEAVIKKLKENM